MSIVRLLFLFLCYGDHRELYVLPHAFPTRRASDLVGSRFQSRRRPLAVISSPASLSIGPAGRWLPGSQAGNSRVSGPGCTGISCFTRKMRWARSVASTSMSIVPGYATSTGGGTAACAVEAANGDDSARATASDRLARYERRMRRFLRFSGQSPSSPGLGRSSPCHWAWWCGGTGKRKVARAVPARKLLSSVAGQQPHGETHRSAERRVAQECVSPCGYRRVPAH